MPERQAACSARRLLMLMSEGAASRGDVTATRKEQTLAHALDSLSRNCLAAQHNGHSL